MKKILVVFVLISCLTSFSQDGKPGPNITDMDGNNYKTVFIGTQHWMAENLKTSRYNDGTIIPKIIDDLRWSGLKLDACSDFKNDTTVTAKYGRLYNWYAVNGSKYGNKNVCPSGWHVPTDEEWKVLVDYLGGENLAGGKMKEVVGTLKWKDLNKEASNSSLFSAQPMGIRNWSGLFSYTGDQCYWWSSTGVFNIFSEAWAYTLHSRSNNVGRSKLNRGNGFSIRCLKD